MKVVEEKNKLQLEVENKFIYLQELVDDMLPLAEYEESALELTLFFIYFNY